MSAYKNQFLCAALGALFIGRSFILSHENFENVAYDQAYQAALEGCVYDVFNQNSGAVDLNKQNDNQAIADCRHNVATESVIKSTSQANRAHYIGYLFGTLLIFGAGAKAWRKSKTYPHPPKA